MDSPAKRLGRTGSSFDEPPRPTRSVPWFDDGNVVLEAEQTQFRVYRGILSVNSIIFKDMFSLCQPGEEGEVEGCPLVHLSDSAQDVQLVLEVLHDSSQSQFAAKDKLPLTVVSAFLRLGKKYEIEHLQSEALRRLRKDYPSNLRAYDKLSSKTTCIVGYRGKAAEVIRLAHETNSYSILPAALYACCKDYTYEELLTGRRRPDGSIATLTYDDQKLCILAKEKLIRKQAVETFSWLKPDHATSIDCTRDQCAQTRKDLVQEMWYPTPSCAALKSWKAGWEVGMCGNCIASSVQKHAVGREKIWNLLPSIFELPPWEELLKN